MKKNIKYLIMMIAIGSCLMIGMRIVEEIWKKPVLIRVVYFVCLDDEKGCRKLTDEQVESLNDK